MGETTRLEQARDAILACQGYGLASLSFSVIDTADALHLNLRWGPPRPDLTLSIQNVHYFALQRLPNDDIPFFDLEATVLPPDQPWPDRLQNLIGYRKEMTPLLWIHGDGPASFDILAAIVTVLSELNP